MRDSFLPPFEPCRETLVGKNPRIQKPMNSKPQCLAVSLT
jgi:hypothetical protein